MSEMRTPGELPDANSLIASVSGGENRVFQVGELYSHDEVYQQLEVGNAGGIRPLRGKDGEVRRLVLMTSDASAKIRKENPYHDRIEEDVLVFTAAGREGKQEFSGINRRLLDQAEVPFPIYGFCNIGSRRDPKLGQRRWRFLGLLQYLRHFRESQIDARGQQRNSVVFELLIHSEPSSVPVKHDSAISATVCRAARESGRLDLTDRDVSCDSGQIRAKGVLRNTVEIESRRRMLFGLSPEEFEHVVKDALRQTGFEGAAVTRFTGDGGIDVNAFAGPKLWPIQGCMLQIQAKRWRHTVGRREVAELRGSLRPHARGAIVTTSFYSTGAVTEAAEEGKVPVMLINGMEFAEILLRP